MRRPTPTGESPQGRVLWESVTAFVMFLPEDNHRPPHPFTPVSCKPSFFLLYLFPFPLRFSFFLSSLSPPFCLSSHFFPAAILCWREVRKIKSISDMGFDPLQPNSVTCHRDNYCEKEGQQEQEKPMIPESVQQKREEIKGSNKDG